MNSREFDLLNPSARPDGPREPTPELLGDVLRRMHEMNARRPAIYCREVYVNPLLDDLYLRTAYVIATYQADGRWPLPRRRGRPPKFSWRSAVKLAFKTTEAEIAESERPAWRAQLKAERAALAPPSRALNIDRHTHQRDARLAQHNARRAEARAARAAVIAAAVAAVHAIRPDIPPYRLASLIEAHIKRSTPEEWRLHLQPLQPSTRRKLINGAIRAAGIRPKQQRTKLANPNGKKSGGGGGG